MINVVKLVPSGFCCGVVDAWKKVQQTILKYPDKKIYLLGLFVHNPKMMEWIDQSKVTLLNSTNKTLEQLIEELPVSKDQDIIICSAHGTPIKLIYQATKKGYYVVDTKCIYIEKTHQLIQNDLDQGIQVAFIGVKNHQETNTTLAISEMISPIYDLNDLANLVSKYQDKPIAFYNQTTLSIIDLEHYFQFIQKHFSQPIIHNEICLATSERQLAVINYHGPCDLFIVVGHHTSNNSLKLAELGKLKGYPTILINGIDDLDLKLLENVKNVLVTAGASTPTNVTREIIDYIKKY